MQAPFLIDLSIIMPFEKQPSQSINVAAGIILQGNKVLIAKRPDNKHQGGLWEFPGGKIEGNETSDHALKRELQEELNLIVIKSEFFQKVDFDYSDKSVSLLFFVVTEFSGEPQGVEDQEIKWVCIEDLNKYDFPSANQIIVKRLKEFNL